MTSPLGADGDHIDAYLGPHIKSPHVWVIDQIDANTKAYDEAKAFIGFGSKQQVVSTYQKAFSDGCGLERIGAIHEMSIGDFKSWLKSGNTVQPLKAGGIVPTKSSPKITRSAFLYLPPKPPKNRFAQCSTCSQFTGSGCLIHDKKVHVTPTMSCGLYIHGKPQINRKGQEKATVTPEQSGLIDCQVRCENCRFSGDNGCGLYRMLNQRMPEDFDLDPKIEPQACCNAYTQKSAKA